MNKLLSAHFARIFHNKVFWVGMIGMFALGIFVPIHAFIGQQRDGGTVYFDSLFFIYVIPIGLISAAFCSLFLGSEYSDGTMRNKVVVGHSRTHIYLSGLIACSAAGLMISLAYILAICLVGIPLLGMFTIEVPTLLLLLLGSVMMILAFTALFVLLGMLNQNKALVAVISITAFVALFFLATYLNAMLTAPEYYDGYVLAGENGEMVMESMLNPNYLRGMEREITQFFYDFLPTGQALQYANLSAGHLWQMPLYSLLILTASTLSGIAAFRKKDLQ